MDSEAIDRQARRARRAIARLDRRLSPASVRDGHATGDTTEIRVRRRGDNSVVRLVYAPVLVDLPRLQSELIQPLSSSSGPVTRAVPMARKVVDRSTADDLLLQGTVLVFDGSQVYGVALGTLPTRQIAEPSTERAVIGPKDALVEPLDSNIALVRGHLRDARLQVQRLTVGTSTHTEVAILYLDGVADAQTVDRLWERLRNYRPARLGFVSQLMRPLFGAIWTNLMPLELTERPYRVADYLARGRIAVLADGSPQALVTPVFFVEYFIDEEEYLQATLTRWFVRGLRALAFFVALMAPGLYVAILSVNPTIMPGLLAIAISSSRETLPYPIVTETFLMIVVLDIMAEATVSMKGILGPAISIVGSLIIGDAAVRANLASSLGVILVAVTALATFITPRYPVTYAVRVLKYPVLAISAMFGLIGWTLSAIWLLAYLSSTRSLGAPFLLPVAPFVPGAMDTGSPTKPGSDHGSRLTRRLNPGQS